MNLQIVVERSESGSTYLIVDPGDTESPVIDAYPTRAEAENFLQFIGQTPADSVTQ